MTYAITIMIILENNCDKSKFPLLDKISRKISFIAIVFLNNHGSYLIFRGRNMPPYKDNGKLTQILSVTVLVKQGPWSLLIYSFRLNVIHVLLIQLADLTLSQTSPGFYVSVVKVLNFENTEGKGEIARDEQFLPLPQCFLPIWRTFCHFH